MEVETLATCVQVWVGRGAVQRRPFGTHPSPHWGQHLSPCCLVASWWASACGMGDEERGFFVLDGLLYACVVSFNDLYVVVAMPGQAQGPARAGQQVSVGKGLLPIGTLSPGSFEKTIIAMSILIDCGFTSPTHSGCRIGGFPCECIEQAESPFDMPSFARPGALT